MKLIELYQNISSRLINITNSKTESSAEADLILSSSLASKYIPKKFSKELLYGSLSDHEVSDGLDSFINFVISKRKEGIPLQYILNEAWFFGLKFSVFENELQKTFIPRTETEIIIQESLTHLNNLHKDAIALDIGTGSGAIPISITVNHDKKLEWDAIDPYLTDIPSKNARYHSVEDQIKFFKSNIIKFIPKINKRYNLITANLPYVPLGSQIGREVRYEPMEAIYGGNDGLLYIKEVLDVIPKILQDKGLVIFEIDPSQDKFFQTLKSNNKVKVINDLQDLPRIASIYY
jgi:release factor glutamine methyltransferase